jgi:hypothetical protein
MSRLTTDNTRARDVYFFESNVTRNGTEGRVEMRSEILNIARASNNGEKHP